MIRQKNNANRQPSFTDSTDNISPEFDNTVIRLKKPNLYMYLSKIYLIRY